jgi:hypothetical protein
MTNSTTRVTLLGGDGARRRAGRRLMPWLTTVVTQTLLRGAVFGNVTDWPGKAYVRFS